MRSCIWWGLLYIEHEVQARNHLQVPWGWGWGYWLTCHVVIRALDTWRGSTIPHWTANWKIGTIRIAIGQPGVGQQNNRQETHESHIGNVTMVSKKSFRIPTSVRDGPVMRQGILDHFGQVSCDGSQYELISRWMAVAKKSISKAFRSPNFRVIRCILVQQDQTLSCSRSSTGTKRNIISQQDGQRDELVS